MTHDEMIEIIEAHRDGKTVQMLRSDETPWESIAVRHAFNFMGFAYRVKPEPREWWLVECGKTITGPYDVPQVIGDSKRLIHVREVLPE